MVSGLNGTSDMDWHTPVDLYCERTATGLWAEPLNAVSNLAFIAVGLLLWSIGRQRQVLAVAQLGVMVVLIGLASGAFHLWAERWAEVADIAAIALTLLLWVCLWLRQIAGWRWRTAWLGAPLFVGFSLAVSAVIPPSALNGSAGYAPPLLTLLLLAAAHRWLQVPGGARLMAAAGVFAVSLAFRSLDLALCPHWPHGTHFVWHILNAVTLGLAASALSLSPRRPHPAAPV